MSETPKKTTAHFDPISDRWGFEEVHTLYLGPTEHDSAYGFCLTHIGNANGRFLPREEAHDDPQTHAQLCA